MIDNPFDAMSPEEKDDIHDQLVDLGTLLKLKEQMLLNCHPKWWQFRRKKKYRAACQEWIKVAEAYNSMIYLYNCSMVFEDSNNGKQPKETIQDNVSSKSNGDSTN